MGWKLRIVAGKGRVEVGEGIVAGVAGEEEDDPAAELETELRAAAAVAVVGVGRLPTDPSSSAVVVVVVGEEG